MPVFDQGYQHWNGRLAGHALRWLAITREGVRTQWKKKGTKAMITFGFAPALILATILIIWGLLEQQSSLLEPFEFLLRGLPEEIRSGPRAYRTSVWTLAFNIFLQIQTFFIMILVLHVGPDLISQDLRFNAIPLYLSRPIRRIDYFAGKLGVIATYVGAVAIGPAVAAYLLGVAFSFELSVFRDTGRLLLATIGWGTLTVFSAGSLMLAFSSLSRNSQFVGALWIMLWVLGNVAASALSDTVRADWCPLVSYTRNLDRMREVMLDTQSAVDQFQDLIDASRRSAEQAARAMSPLGRLAVGRNFPKSAPDRPRPPRSRRPRESDHYEDNGDRGDHDSPRRRRGGLLEQMVQSDHPWTWSAGVLAGLFGLSALILTTRVKSLDRMR